MIMRKPSRPWTMAMFTSLLLVALCNYGGKATALAGNVTVAVESSTNNTIFPRVVYISSGTPSRDYPAVPPNGRIEISFEHDKLLSLFFATGCSQDESSNLRNCSTGDCPEGGCSAVDQPVATSINYDKGTFTTSTVHGYNFGLDGIFECVGCDCPPISCIIPLNRCPENLMILGESGSPVGCKAGDGVPSCQDCAAASGFDSRPSPGTTCFDSAILKITVSSPKECAG